MSDYDAAWHSERAEHNDPDRPATNRRERLYGDNAPDQTELAQEDYWDAVQRAREERDLLHARHEEWYA